MIRGGAAAQPGFSRQAHQRDVLSIDGLSDPRGGGIVVGEEGGDELAELRGLLQVGAVARVGEDVTARAGDALGVRLPGGRGGFVELARDDQRGSDDLRPVAR